MNRSSTSERVPQKTINRKLLVFMGLADAGPNWSGSLGLPTPPQKFWFPFLCPSCATEITLYIPIDLSKTLRLLSWEGYDNSHDTVWQVCAETVNVYRLLTTDNINVCGDQVPYLLFYCYNDPLHFTSSPRFCHDAAPEIPA
jgi:hypothetical protein